MGNEENKTKRRKEFPLKWRGRRMPGEEDARKRDKI